ncbi:MAG: hypothetical protein ACI4PH_00390 [Faecousia sp.]
MSEHNLFAGAGKAEIRFPEEMFPTAEGYNKIHDAPHARMILLRSRGERYAFAHLELNNIFEPGTAKMLEVIRQETGIPEDHVFFHCLHVLETPHPEPPMKKGPEAERYNGLFYGAVEQAVRQACRQAMDKMEPARVGADYSVCATCNTNRNVLTDKGWWLGSGESEPSDKAVAVVRFEDLQGKPIAILFAYNAQSSVMDQSRDADGSRYVTADLAGASAAFVEGQFDGCVAMYCTGAGGDGCPSFQAKRNVLGAGGKLWSVDLHETGFLLVELLGERLGSVVVQCAEKIPCRDVQEIKAVTGKVDFEGRPRVNLREIGPTHSFDLQGDGSVNTMEPALLAIGEDIALVGVFAEICARTEMQIKQQSPFPFTAVMTFSQLGNHVGKGMGKYMGERDMYERITFQAMNSGVTAGSAERLAEYLADFLKQTREA